MLSQCCGVERYIKFMINQYGYLKSCEGEFCNKCHDKCQVREADDAK